MRVLVIGASGFLGRSVVRACASAGHEVLGAVRVPAGETAVREDHGVPTLCDAADPAGLRSALRGCDAAVHVASPSGREPVSAENPAPWERSRVTVATNLVAAARELGVPRVLIGSGYWLYGDHPDVITESSSSQPYEAVEYNWRAEQAGLAGHRPGTLDVLVARPSMVYGNGAWFRPMLDSIRAGTYRYIEDGTNRWSPIGREDCGEGFRTVLERGRGGETYILADDLPVPIRTFTEFVAGELHAPTPSGIPWASAVEMYGADVARALRANQAASNHKLRSLGWVPIYPTFRDGVPSAIREILSSPNPA
jgi:nucleoside-diphosphate-sugar epimerase